MCFILEILVSTHSRPKAAGQCGIICLYDWRSFNTQPPEGGWANIGNWQTVLERFNTQPPEGGWIVTSCFRNERVSFNIQPPEGGWQQGQNPHPSPTSFNTQPPEGGWPPTAKIHGKPVCFNTQPPEGGWGKKKSAIEKNRGFNTQPPEGGWCHPADSQTDTKLFQHTAARRRLATTSTVCKWLIEFQHTAARRRLGTARKRGMSIARVSTHSRPKAAGLMRQSVQCRCRSFQHTAARRRLGYWCSPWCRHYDCFNTQPPEGGWGRLRLGNHAEKWFQHTAARRRLDAIPAHSLR